MKTLTTSKIAIFFYFVLTKFLLFVGFILLLSIFSAVVQSEKLCPPTSILGKNCICYEETLNMLCTALDQEWIKMFKPEKLYEINILVIKDSPNLPLFGKKFQVGNHPTGVSYKSLIIYVKTHNIERKSFNSLISGATDTLEVKVETPNMLEIDCLFLNDKLKSISLSNVKVTNLDKFSLDKLRKIHSLILNSVTFENEIDFNFIRSETLTRIEIFSCTSLKGTFQYIPPAVCPVHPIVLNFKNNLNLKHFDMSRLFNNKSCQYNIDLSGSNLNSSFFLENQKYIDKANTPDQLNIVLRDVDGLVCNQCTLRWYLMFPGHMHSVQCKGINGTQMSLDKLKLSELPFAICEH